MKERSFDEMIAYFNRTVAEMDIAKKYKMALLGMIGAIGYKHKKEAQRWISCSERLPELTAAFSDAEGFEECEDGFYMPVGVYTAYESNAVLAFGTFEGNKNIFTAIYNEWRYEDGRKESEWRDNMTGDVEINVIAWMPLPEPWRGDANEQTTR